LIIKGGREIQLFFRYLSGKEGKKKGVPLRVGEERKNRGSRGEESPSLFFERGEKKKRTGLPAILKEKETIKKGGLAVHLVTKKKTVFPSEREKGKGERIWGKRGRGSPFLLSRKRKRKERKKEGKKGDSPYFPGRKKEKGGGERARGENRELPLPFLLWKEISSPP